MKYFLQTIFKIFFKQTGSKISKLPITDFHRVSLFFMLYHIICHYEALIEKTTTKVLLSSDLESTLFTSSLYPFPQSVLFTPLLMLYIGLLGALMYSTLCCLSDSDQIHHDMFVLRRYFPNHCSFCFSCHNMIFLLFGWVRGNKSVGRTERQRVRVRVSGSTCQRVPLLTHSQNSHSCDLSN